ncbi:hypothetical protein VWS67_003552 [Cronobacter sakazakii]|uniref:hypothetical protein n=1 Tax=Cronobacter sakazakii TaxID=28141 RepID=UPI0012D3ADDA|nr:hypothetical protein [Cronobacter sakazakii]EIZ9683023.1 hypothetical protein [Cronobacter sakazakii]EJA3086243.1 hypothetical protein [Cronobacter sakazakii]EJA3090335.1 hypothetical protein [Cronobacter sakazakii]EJB0296138.1 hypothetical protein [Cronobacter sakazakii]EJC8186194.1 hypothetical protein [Cronobacter sakazakii]
MNGLSEEAQGNPLSYLPASKTKNILSPSILLVDITITLTIQPIAPALKPATSAKDKRVLFTFKFIYSTGFFMPTNELAFYQFLSSKKQRDVEH